MKGALLKFLKRTLFFFIKYVLSRFLLLAIFIALFVGLAQYGYNFVDYMRTPMITSKKSITIDVRAGMTAENLFNEIQAKLPEANTQYLKLYGRITGTLNDIKVGEYEVSDDTLPAEFWNAIIKGRSVQYSFTIIDGWTFKDVRKALANNKHVVQTLTADQTPEEIMTLIGYEGLPYEGYFLPETYLFPKNYSDVDILKRSYAMMKSYVDKVWLQRDADLPIKDKHELLTLASIVEKETGVASERSEIAGVFVRRLQKSMRLQTDPTVIYGIGDKYDGKIYRSDLQRDTPYNTYTREGLPPTPIAMPSMAAIYAAAHPKDGTALYFVAKGDGSGEHVFSDNLNDHNNAVKVYRQRLRLQGQ